VLRWVTFALVGLASAIVLVSIVFWRRTNPGRLMAQDAAQVGAAPVRPLPSTSERPGWSTTPAAAAAAPTARRRLTTPASYAPAGAAARVPAAAVAVSSAAGRDPWAAPTSNGPLAPVVPAPSVPSDRPAPSPRPPAPVTVPPAAAPVVRPAPVAPVGSSTAGPVEPAYPHGLWASSGWDDPAEEPSEPAPGGGGGHRTAPPANPFDDRR
jgi:hypothetical protein